MLIIKTEETDRITLKIKKIREEKKVLVGK